VGFDTDMAMNSLADVLQALEYAVARIAPTDIASLAKAHSRFSEIAHWARAANSPRIEKPAIASLKFLEHIILDKGEATERDLAVLSESLTAMHAILTQGELSDSQSFPPELFLEAAGTHRDPERDENPTPVVNAQMLTAFAETAQAAIDHANVQLLALESDSTDDSALKNLCRSITVIEREARELGLHDVALLSGRLARLAETARRGDIELEGEQLAVAFDALDALARWTTDPTALSSSGTRPAEVDSTLRQLQQVINGTLEKQRESGIAPAGKRLGELMVESGALTESDVQDILREQSGDTARQRRLGELLVQEGAITKSDLDQAVALQREDPELGRLGDILVQMGAATEEEVAQVFGGQQAKVPPKFGEVVIRTHKTPAKAVGEAVRGQGLLRSFLRMGIDAVKKLSDLPDEERSALKRDPEVLQAFADKAKSQLRVAELQLLALESGAPTASASLNSTIRVFHTLKRVAGYLELDDISDYSRQVERLFKKVRAREIDLEGPALDAGLEAVNGINRLIERLEHCIASNQSLTRDPQAGQAIASVRALAEGRRARVARASISTGSIIHKKLGELLVEAGVATQQDIDALLKAQADTPNQRRLGEYLTELGLINDEDLHTALEIQKNQPDRGKLGDILVQIGAIDGSSLHDALQAQKSGARPKLGEMLARTGKASPGDVARVVRSQNFIKDLIAFGVTPSDKDDHGGPDPDMIRSFIDRTRKHLEAADVNLLRLEENPGEERALEAVRRAMRGIKRVAGYIGFDAVHAFTFEFEKLCENAAATEITLEGHVLDFAFDAIEILEQHIGQLEVRLKKGRRGKPDPALQHYTAQLKAVAAGDVDILRREPIAPTAYKPTRLGELLVESGAITPEQLSLALQEQASEPETQKLGELLLDEVRISPAQLDAALEAQKKDPSLKFGDALVAMGAIDPDELREFLRQQQERRKKKLGEILVRRGYASAKTVAHAVRSQQAVAQLVRAGATAAVIGVAITSPYAQAQENSTYAGGSVVITVQESVDIDTDADSLTDSVEAALGTDPTSIDTDQDGIDDAWEVFNGLDPLDPSDAHLDPDQDGLTNLDEYTYGTAPFEADSDADGWHDHIEVQRGTDPAAADSTPQPAMQGDVNADGVVDAGDIQLVINAALGMETPVPANVDQVGDINAIDVQLVIKNALQ